MNMMEHFNAFCVAFGEAKSLFDSGKKSDRSFTSAIEKMVIHYQEFEDNKQMATYVKRWNTELVNLGFWIKYHNPWIDHEVPRVDVSDILQNEEEFKVSGEEEYVKIRSDVAYKDGQKVLVGNYCEFSTPWSNIDESEKSVIMKKTIENIQNSSLGIRNPDQALKKIKKVNRKPIWTISDYERDW
jgi:hypothetical protein